MSVKVGVRVRPFNKRQLQLECRRCVQMEGSTTHLIQTDGSVRNFVYDYSFWSHDKFMVDPDGINIPVDDKYADQKRVYDECGSDILINAWQGYNCCLFAYGQTGSGKSYSMIGYGANRGIIPIVCDQIFKKIKTNEEKNTTFEVMISMMEIYNEAVRDLLQKNKKKQLKICESKKLGVYVEGLYKHAVYSYEQIAKKIQQGSNNRSIAATLMNESSSRSHTIVSINFIQKIQVSAYQTSIKYSVIHLVDLAGSECVAKTGVDSKDRLRQTAKINQSLSTLGRVIEILADNASKIEKQFVPYRDSKLTFILRNALGGNSRTTMICAISPADDNLQETLSTLRYASRAKKIQNKALVNESDVDKLIRMLRQENQQLKKMLQDAKFTKTVINQEVISNYNRMSQNMAEFGINFGNEEMLLDQIGQMDNGNQIQQASQAQDQWQQGKLVESAEQNLSFPYITNISQDQLLSFRVKYNCQDLMIGNKNGNPKPDVILAALGIHPNHARIYADGELNGVKKIFMEVLAEEAEDYTYVNGQNLSIKEKKQLFDNDRLVFGTGCIFLVVIFGGQQRNQTLIKIESIDYQFAINELQNVNLDRSRIISGENEQQIRKKIVLQVQKQYQDIKKLSEQSMKKQIYEQQLQYQERLRQIQNQKNQQTQKLKEQLQRKHNESKLLEIQKNKVYEEIERYRLMQKQMENKLLEKAENQKPQQNQLQNYQQQNQLEQEKLMVMEQSEGEPLEKIERSKSKKQKEKETRRQKEAEEELEKTNQILLDKLYKISVLQQKIGQINEQNILKETLIKEQLEKQEKMVQKQLQFKNVMCQNENIITEYRLQLVKKTKNSKQLRQLLVKKEKAFLQKQLIELVPMIEKFNLMGKQMNRRIEAGLSIEYKYISESEIIEALKNNTYKSKLKILIHIINKEEGRGYYWSVEVFKNRFQHAIDAFQLFLSKSYIKQQSQLYREKKIDPYWEPKNFQVFGLSYASLECLLYQFSFCGTVSIVSQGKKLGQMEISLWPLTVQGGIFLRVDQVEQTIKIFNPRDLIERSLSFEIEIKNVSISSEDFNIQKMRIQYEILQSNYKARKYQTEEFLFKDAKKFHYSKHHTISQISENSILHYTDRPVSFHVFAIIKLNDEDQLTNRESFASSKMSSFAANKNSFSNLTCDDLETQAIVKNLGEININQFVEVSPHSLIKKDFEGEFESRSPNMTKKTGAIVQNIQIMSKIQNDYIKKKKQPTELEKKKYQQSLNNDRDNKKKKKDDNCTIY